MPYVFDDALEEGGEARYFAGAEEGEGMVLDERRPVGAVGIERVEELVLDSGLGGRRPLSVVLFWCEAEAEGRGTGQRAKGGFWRLT